MERGVWERPASLAEAPLSRADDSLGLITGPLGLFKDPLGFFKDPLGLIAGPLGLAGDPLGTVLLSPSQAAPSRSFLGKLLRNERYKGNVSEVKMPDIPGSDAQFDAFWTAFMAYATPNLAALGIVALNPEWTNLTTAKTDWDAKFPAHLTAQSNAEAARAAKDVSRATGQAALEHLIGMLRANPAVVSDAELQALGLSLYDTIRTPAPVPTTRPVLKIDHSQRQQHRISWVDEATPTSVAKPAGVHGCELFLKVGGAAPAGIAECDQIVVDTKTPYLYEFDPSAFGQAAYWIGRWQNTRGETGPISETVTATVVA